MLIMKIRGCYLGHVLHNKEYQPILLILQGRSEFKRTQGRCWTSWLENVGQSSCQQSCESARLLISTEDRHSQEEKNKD